VFKTEKKRTLRQNNSLHLYFNHLSKALNDAGLDVQTTLKHNISVPWSDKTVKELIYKPILKAQLGKDSTTQMTTKEIDLVFDTITRFTSEKLGLQVDFPSIETLMWKERLKV